MDLLYSFLRESSSLINKIKKYDQKIRTANNEILYAVRPLIVEKTKPSIKVLNSILYSTARKYNVELSDIYNTHTLCDDLTNEIMSNSFLSSEQKIELAELINKLKDDESELKEDKVKRIIIHTERKVSSINPSFMSVTLSLMTAMTALIFFFVIRLKQMQVSIHDTNFSESLSIMLVVTIVPIVALVLTGFLKYLKDKEKVAEKKKLKDLSIKDKDDKIDSST